MKRIKQRCEIEFPKKKRTAQSLVDNTRRFEKKSLTSGEDNNLQAQKNIDQTTKMKIKL